MLQSYKLKEWVRWPAVRAHVCSGALALAFPATWRGPRFAFALGGAPYALAVTLALLGVALPLALLQLAVGQLSQQDAVGVWRAVPFFTGVGYLRLLISLLCSVYSIIYLAMTTTYFLYTISNSLPFWECIELVLDQEDYVNAVNASTCLKDTFMGPVQERPEYYLAVALIILVLWIVFPFIFYNPVKLMKRILYGLGPSVLLLMVVTLACVGDASSLAAMGAPQHWRSFLEPAIWHAAVVHALLATHIAGGFLIAAGDTVYSTTNVQWTAVAVTAANVASTWLSVVFWHALSGAERDAGVFAVLVAAYQLGDDVDTDLAWPLTVFLTLLLSGFITMLALLYPVFERCRRAGGAKWRALGFAGALAGALLSLAALWGRLPALTLLADFVVPLLVSIATLLEILAFVFIYGWKVLVEDVEFLTGNELAKFWVLGWCSAPGIIAPFTAWWLAAELAREPARPGPALALLGAAALALLVLLACAAVAVARQKLKSSFKPSRHWGPRDPITHYYWLARREHLDRGGVARARYQRRQLGQLSGRPSFLNLSHSAREREEETVSVGKVRSNSDDLLYTVCRKQQARVQVPGVPGTRASGARGPGARARARSLDGGLTLQPLPSMHRDALVTLGLDNTILK